MPKTSLRTEKKDFTEHVWKLWLKKYKTESWLLKFVTSSCICEIVLFRNYLTETPPFFPSSLFPSGKLKELLGRRKLPCPPLSLILPQPKAELLLLCELEKGTLSGQMHPRGHILDCCYLYSFTFLYAFLFKINIIDSNDVNTFQSLQEIELVSAFLYLMRSHI